MAAGGLRIGLYSGRLVEGDAISNSLRCKQALLERWRRDGAPITVSTFAQDADASFPDATVVRSPSGLLAHSAFGETHIHMFEYGIYYSLFNAVLLIAPGAAAGATYHNITPAELVESQAVKDAIARSLDQRQLLARLDHIACDSELNLRELAMIGIPETSMTVVPLPTPTTIPMGPARSGRDGPVRILFVGRPVKAKGILDLAQAVRQLGEDRRDFSLTLIGRLDYADADILAAISDLSSDPAMQGRIELLANHPAEAMPAAFNDADVLVMPSYHEGYCVPVLEALSAGCHVIAYDNSNLPAITAGLARLVPTGSVEGLAAALGDFVARLSSTRSGGGRFVVPTSRGDLPEDDWRQAAATRTGGVPAAFEAGMLEVMGHLVKACAPHSRGQAALMDTFKDFICSRQSR